MKQLSLVLLGIICLSGAFGQTRPAGDLNGCRVRTTEYAPSTPAVPSIAGNDWLPVGPFGGDVTDLAVLPQQPLTLFATAGTPFISTDGGSTWSALEPLAVLAGGPVNCIESAANGILLATGTYAYGKVYRSADGGLSWQSRTLPVNVPGTCIAMDPNDTITMYLGLLSNTASSVNKVVVKSINGGLNWTALDLTAALPVGYNVESLCVDPDNSQTLFAIGREGFSNSIVAASFDGGLTWEDRTGSLPAGLPYNEVAIGGQQVYVAGGQLFGSQNMGVYASADYGLSWTNISGSFPNKVSNTILIDPSNSDHLCVGTEGDGVYISTDGGGSWDYTITGAGAEGSARTLLFSPASPDTIYAGYLSIAVCKSTDAGANWSYSSTGIATLMVNDVEVNPANQAMVLAGFEAENSGGCYLSTDTGATWSLVAGLPGTRFSKVGFFADGALCAWSNGPTTIGQEGLYKSTDNGETWVNKGPNVGNLFETEIFALATSATDPGLVFVGGNNFGVNGWKSVIHRSTNGGQSWDNVYVGLDDYDSFRYLFIDPSSNDQIIYAAMKSETQGALLRSTDGGDTWTVISGGISGPEKWFGSVICDPDSTQKLFAGTGGYGTSGKTWISVDAGESWSGTDLSLGSYSKIQDLFINPDNTSVVYAASSDDGVRLSADGGWSWDAANNGMSAVNVSAFSKPWPSSSGWNIFASTATNSIFRTAVFDPATGIKEPFGKTTVTVYPNPSDGNITLRTGKTGAKELKIEMYNSSGILVGTWFPQTVSASETSLKLNLTPGLYLGRMTTDGVTESFKIFINP